MERCVGVFVLDNGSGRLSWRLLEPRDFLIGDDVWSPLEQLSRDMAETAGSMSGPELLSYLEDRRADGLHLTRRQPIHDVNPSDALDLLFKRHVSPQQ